MGVRAGAAIVAVVGRLASTDHTARHFAVERVATLLADNQSLKQPARPATPIALALAALVQLSLHRLEYVGINNRGYRNSDPLLARNRSVGAVAVAGRLAAAADGTQAGASGRDHSGAAEHGGSPIRRIAQHPVEGGGIPVLQSGAGHATHTLQSTASIAQTYPLDADPAKQLSNHLGLVLNDLELGSPTAGMPVDIAIAKRSATHRTDSAGARRMASPTPAAFQNAGALILGDHALNLQQQIVLGRTANRSIEEDDVNTAAAKLLDQQNLIGIPPGQPIGSVHINPIELATRHGVAQAFQSWASQRGAAAALVDVGMMRIDGDRVGTSPLVQSCKLAGDRIATCLAICGHAGVEASRDATHV